MEVQDVQVSKVEISRLLWSNLVWRDQLLELLLGNAALEVQPQGGSLTLQKRLRPV